MSRRVAATPSMVASMASTRCHVAATPSTRESHDRRERAVPDAHRDAIDAPHTATTRKHHDNNAGAACQVEKVDHATALQMTKTLGSIKQVGTSLGSFSLTASLLSVLTQRVFIRTRQEEGPAR